MANDEQLLEQVKETERSSPGLKEQLDNYRKRRRTYDEMQKGKGQRETVGKEQRTERRYNA